MAAWLIAQYDWRIMFLMLGLGSLVWLVPWMGLVTNDDRQIETRGREIAPPRTPSPFAAHHGAAR